MFLQKKRSVRITNRSFYPKKTYLIHNLTYGPFKDTVFMLNIKYLILGVFDKLFSVSCCLSGFYVFCGVVRIFQKHQDQIMQNHISQDHADLIILSLCPILIQL